MRPLTGIRVLDLSRLLPGPFATLVLADLGATVDKVEDPAPGDYLRHIPPHVAGESAAFQLLNRGKRGVVLDLKKKEAQAAVLRMIAHYDVLFDQFRPGVLARLGLAPEALLAENPKLVICSLTGYGQTGPLAQRAGHDLNYLARAGILGSQGPADGPPQVPGFQLADISGGMWCVIAILAALRERDQTGKGRVLDIAMSDAVVGFAATELGAALAGVTATRGEGTLAGGIAPYNTYLSKDGGAMTLAALEPKFWMAFCTAVGLEASMEALMPGPHQAEIKAKIAAVFASKTRDEWIAWAEHHDCLVEPALSPGELASDAHAYARGLVFTMQTPRGPIPQFRTPVTPHDVAFTPPPRAGEHTRVVLEEAGFSSAEIDQLIACGAAR